MRAAREAIEVTSGPLERLLDRHRHSQNPLGDIGRDALAHAIEQATIGDLRRTEQLVLQFMSTLARTADGATVIPRWMTIWQDISTRIDAYERDQSRSLRVSSRFLTAVEAELLIPAGVYTASDGSALCRYLGRRRTSSRLDLRHSQIRRASCLSLCKVSRGLSVRWPSTSVQGVLTVRAVALAAV